jgi:hypothetical protein
MLGCLEALRGVSPIDAILEAALARRARLTFDAGPSPVGHGISGASPLAQPAA